MQMLVLLIDLFIFFSSKRVAKKLLKDNRDSIPLWNAYAQILASSNEDIGESRRVYATLFQTYQELPAFVYRGAAELEIEAGRLNSALGTVYYLLFLLDNSEHFILRNVHFI
jgi:hypothetical protein